MHLDSGFDPPRGAPPDPAKRDLPADLDLGRRGRIPRYSAARSHHHSVSDGALVLLSGAHGRAVGSCIVGGHRYSPDRKETARSFYIIYLTMAIAGPRKSTSPLRRNI